MSGDSREARLVAVVLGDAASLAALLGKSVEEARAVIAREHQFASWDEYVAHRHSPFEQAVEAIVAGDAAALERLLREHPDLAHQRSRRTHRATLLHYTGANGVENFRQKTPPNIVEIARILLDAGADIDATANLYGGGATTLGLVATSVHPANAGVQIDLIDLLLEHGAAIDQPSAAGNHHSAVNGCLANGRPAAAEHLARRGATLDLEGAAGVGWLETVKELFDGAPPDQVQSGLQWACEYGHTAVVEYLLARGVPAGRIHRGQTALHFAALNGQADIVRLLLDHGARRDILDERWNATPHGWAEHGAEHLPGADTKRGDHEETLRLLRGS